MSDLEQLLIDALVAVAHQRGKDGKLCWCFEEKTYRDQHTPWCLQAREALRVAGSEALIDPQFVKALSSTASEES